MTALSDNSLFADSLASIAAPTESQLLACALGRAGFPAVVAVGREEPARSPGAAPRYALHLSAAIPVAEIIRAFTSLRGRNDDARRKGGPWVALLLSESDRSYREHLRLDGDDRVLAIQRRFRPGAQRRRKLRGIAWTFHGPFKSLHQPIAGSLWRTARQLRRCPHEPRHILRLQLDDAAHDDTAYFAGPRTARKPAYAAAKRLFDICFSLFALLVTLPITLPIALLIKLSDRGPVFFAHKREGLHGRPFGCLKFRTMVMNASELQRRLRAQSQVDGPQFKIEKDPRVTALGRFLRKTNIDELPQFLNVLAGHMSVVGPRPSPFEENQMCPAWREARLSVRPGITGLWQVSRSRTRGLTDFQEWIYFDSQYVERRGFLLDMRIILLTIKEMFGKGA